MVHEAELPGDWQKRETIPAPVPMSSPIPERVGDDYATLAAWYSGFAFCEHYRKVVLAQCRESLRGQKAATSEKVTESRLDDLAHSHSAYLDYLAKHLRGRVAWEREFLAQGGMR